MTAHLLAASLALAIGGLIGFGASGALYSDAAARGNLIVNGIPWVAQGTCVNMPPPADPNDTTPAGLLARTH